MKRPSPRQRARLDAQRGLLRRLPGNVVTVVDLGIEDGLTGQLVRDELGASEQGCYLTGVEAHYPTWEKAPTCYDNAVNVDAIGYVACEQRPRHHLAIAAELIEHYEKPDGLRLLEALERHRYAIVTTPIGFMPQGELYGNPFQVHRSGWEPEEFTDRGWRAELVSDDHNLGVYTWGF